MDADQDGVGKRFFYALLDLLPKWITAAQLARIDPYILFEVAERLLHFAHKAIILRAMGDEESAHIPVPLPPIQLENPGGPMEEPQPH